MVVHTFNHNIQEAEAEDLCEFVNNLLYQASSRTARLVKQINPVSKKNTKKEKRKKLDSFLIYYNPITSSSQCCLCHCPQTH